MWFCCGSFYQKKNESVHNFQYTYDFLFRSRKFEIRFSVSRVSAEITNHRLQSRVTATPASHMDIK